MDHHSDNWMVHSVAVPRKIPPVGRPRPNPKELEPQPTQYIHAVRTPSPRAIARPRRTRAHIAPRDGVSSRSMSEVMHGMLEVGVWMLRSVLATEGREAVRC